MREPAPGTEEELEERLSRPPEGVAEVLRRVPGDLLILGAGGKMGLTLARMARRAMPAARRVVAVSRFTQPSLRDRFERLGVGTEQADLLDPAALARLPDAANLIFMAGQKFGTSAAPHTTWAMNAIVPALVSARYAGARIVVFSTGNVYPLTPVTTAGPAENHPVGPIGEYAMSCLARERIFEHAAATAGTPVAILRLNYAIDLRYGVLVDTAQRVLDGLPISLRMGFFNAIWQGDANARALQCLPLAASPAAVLNVTGAERVSVRWLAEQFGARFGKAPILAGEEEPDALLSDASRSIELFGPPTVDLATMIDWTGSWLEGGGRTLGKPTNFEERRGRF